MSKKQTNDTTPTILFLHPSELVPAPWFNRTDLNLTPEFLEDIATHGVRQNLLARVNPDASDGAPPYEIIAGVRRWSAAKEVGLSAIPVRIENLDDKAAREARLTENLQREGLSVLDEAWQYQQALDAGDYGDGRHAIDALASSVGRSRSHIYSRLRLLKLTGPAADALQAGQIDPTVAELIATIPTTKQQAAVLKEVLEHTEYSRETGQKEKAAMSFRDVKELINDEYRKSLADAPFDQKATYTAINGDARLGCDGCPHRTGNMENLPGGSRPDVCTLVSCYHEKVAAHQAQVLEKLKASGKTVLEGKDAPKFEHGYLPYNSPYMEAGGQKWIGERQEYVAYKKALGKKMPELLYAVNPNGEVLELVRRKELDAALVAAGVTKPLVEAKETKEDKAKRAEEEQVQTRAQDNAVGLLLKKLDGGKPEHFAEVLQFIIETMDTGDGFNHEVISRRRGWDNGVHLVEAARALASWPEKLGLLLEGYLADPYASTYDEEWVATVAKRLGVKLDSKQLLKEAKAQLEAEAQAKQPPAEEPKAAKASKPKKAKEAK
jgi:ParB/RepB/Spo0J family partition protein